MSDLLTSYGVSSYVSQNILILPFQSDFFREVMEALKKEVLKEIHADPSIRGIILDVSKTRVIDLSNMQELESVLKMASVLGVKAYICGLQPEVTLALVNLGYDNNELNTCLNIEHAISQMYNDINNCSNNDDSQDNEYEYAQD